MLWYSSDIKDHEEEAGNVVELVECLSTAHEALGSISNTEQNHL